LTNLVSFLINVFTFFKSYIKLEDNNKSADDEEERFSDDYQSNIDSPQKNSKISTSQLSQNLDSNLSSKKSTPKNSKGSVMSQRSTLIEKADSKKNSLNNSTSKLNNSPQVLKTLIVDPKESEHEVIDSFSNTNMPKKSWPELSPDSSEKIKIQNALQSTEEEIDQENNITNEFKKSSLEESPVLNKKSVEANSPLLDEIVSPKKSSLNTSKKNSTDTSPVSIKNSVEKTKLSNTEPISKKSSPEIGSDKKSIENKESIDSQQSSPSKTIELYQETFETNGDEFENENENEVEKNLQSQIQPKSDISEIKEESPPKKKLSEKKNSSWCLILRQIKALTNKNSLLLF
jgi:hypothetical protein